MKMTKILSLVLALVMIVSCFAACGGDKPEPSTTQPVGGNEPNPLAGEYNIVMWASELEGVADLFQAQIDKFEAANPGIIINAEIVGVTEADAGSKVIADLATAPDLYCFAQDQLARLVQASALSAPAQAIADSIRALNDGGSVSAASVGGKLYAYPMTSDNGYYMYYDSSIITNPESLEQIIADVEAYNTANPESPKWIRFALENGWYTASFFFAQDEEGNRLCHSDWTTDPDGNFTSVDDNFNSENGLIAMKGMEKLAKSPAYNSDSDAYADSAVWINGIWNATKAQEHFGENFAATDLPSFEVDGKSYHLGSFTGNKLIGVKPQADSNRGLVLHLLAQYFTSEECQLERFTAFEWGPSNLAAQASEAVQANVSLAALAKQGAYGVAQAQIHGSWWDLAKVLGADAKAENADLAASLRTYREAIDALFTMTEEQKMAWSVIGAVNGDSWNTDFPMIQIAEGTWKTVDPITLTATSEFKLRRGADWTVQVGADGQMKTPSIEPANIVPGVEGKYHITLVWDGVSEKATVTWELAE